MPKGVPIQRSVTLRDQVSDAVLGLLRSGSLGPGDRITEEALASRFEVSRTPIREALARLAQRGVLERRRSGGYYVPSLSGVEIQEIVAVRMLLEPPAVRMAVDEFDEKQLQRLDRTIKAQTDAIKKRNFERFSSANEEFHNAIFGVVPNQVLLKAIAQFDPHVHFMRGPGSGKVDRYEKMIERQAEIRDAIARGNGEMAELLWKNYLCCTREWLLDALVGSHEVEIGDEDGVVQN